MVKLKMIFLTASDLEINYEYLFVLAYRYKCLNLFLLTFCICNHAQAIARQDFGEGFAHLPITCSKCNKIHSTYDDLRFDLTFDVLTIEDWHNG